MIRYTACLLLCVLALTESATAKQVSVPVNIEYRYLQQAIAAQFYTGRDRGMEIWNDGEGCGRIILSNPRIDSQNGLLRMTNRAFADIGLPLEPVVQRWTRSRAEQDTVGRWPGIRIAKTVCRAAAFRHAHRPATCAF